MGFQKKSFKLLVSYPILWMGHPSRNVFVLSLFYVLMQVCKAMSAGL
jgi:hypothetical protein